MDVRQAKTLIKNCAKKCVHVPILLIGSKGIGKSWIVKQAAAELQEELKEPFYCIDLRLAQQEPGDLTGLPRVFEEKLPNGQNVNVTQMSFRTFWAKPEYWPKPGTRGIIFWDEINRGPIDVRQSVFQVLNEWKLHTHVLPDTWYQVAAINPDNGNYQVEKLDPAMTRRFCNIAVHARVDVWMDWAVGPGKIDKSITGFINTHQALLYVDEKIELETEQTPDGYRMLNEMMAAGAVPKELEAEVFLGLIGKAAGLAFRQYLDQNYERPVAGEDVLNNYAKVAAKVKKQKDQNAMMHSTVQEVASCLSNIKKMSVDQRKNLIQFILDIGDESGTTLINKMPREFLTDIATDKRLVQKVTDALNRAE